MGVTAKEELVLEDWLPTLGTYTLKDKVGMGVMCVNLRTSPRKGRYVGHLQWDIMRKDPTSRDNLYKDGVLGMGDTIFQGAGNFSQRRCTIRVGLGLGSSR